MISETIDTLNDATFDSEVLRGDRPTLVLFWAPWSRACKRAMESFEELAVEFSDTIASAQVDVDDNPQVAGNYGVTRLPSFILFSEARTVARVSGSTGTRKLREILENFEQ